MEIVIRFIIFVIAILAFIGSCMAQALSRSPSKEMERLFKIDLKKCKKEHKKTKDYEDCSYCLWNDMCRCGKKVRR